MPRKKTKQDKKAEEIDKEKKAAYNFKLFGKWDSNVEVFDLGLKPYINLRPIYIPYSAGRTIKKQFWKSKKHIVERLIDRLMVPGHKGKKHWRTSGQCTGKIITITNQVKRAFEHIEKQTKKNPVEVLVRAIEAGSPREGVATIEYGGMRYPKAADLAPQKRIDLALRWIVQGAYAKAATSKGKIPMWRSLAEEIIATANRDEKSNCIKKKIELERQAEASR